jgi:hypothetical protein
MENKKLSPDAALILEVLYKSPAKIFSISYHYPEKSLELTLAGLACPSAEIRSGLKELESLRVLKLNPELKFGSWPYIMGFGSRCGYEVNHQKVEEVYKSIFL